MKTTAIYPGTFDPLTNGHLDIIQRAVKLFDRVIIGVAASARKAPVFSLQQREELVKLVVLPFKNVKVASFDGLLTEFAKQHEAQVIIRGLRTISDFEYELQLAAMNRQMAPTIETIFLTTLEKNAFISATNIREIISMGGDFTPFVPKEIAKALRKIKK